MHPLTVQALAEARIDEFRHEAEGRRLVAAASDGAPSSRPVAQTRATPVRDRIMHAFGRVHLVHRGSGA